jgi:hypothetical protein
MAFAATIAPESRLLRPTHARPGEWAAWVVEEDALPVRHGGKRMELNAARSLIQAAQARAMDLRVCQEIKAILFC